MDGHAVRLPYAGVGLDRLAVRRKDDAAVAALFAHDATRLVPMWGERSFLAADSSAPNAQRPPLTPALRAAMRAARIDAALLGVREDGSALFAADLAPLADGEREALLGPGTFQPLRDMRTRIGEADLALLGYARALLHWHRTTGYCAMCGAPTRSAEAGHVRACPNEHLHYPRINPAVIMLVTSPVGEPPRCVLGRHGGLPPHMYSTLAGFVEPGESLEETVAREVAEEVGLRVDAIVYQASQPWPFPAQLMIGFHAQAAVAPLHVDPAELDDARWFSLEEVRAFGEAGDPDARFTLPRRDSVARYLVERWMERYAGERPRPSTAP
ncbi:MAG TPA: NAD(+) diphosphatase [Candidatus Sulfotelmatobacter sp.]|nr:NAD(+) diphosphatase [Candidatus Sulfotelmatobacter sp.]